MTDDDGDRRRRFDALFRRYRVDVVSYCRWRAGTPGEAQDAVADVFLAAWRRMHDLPEGDAVRLWLYATARRVIANQRRSHRRRASLRERLVHERLSSGAAVEPADRAELLVHEALAQLGERDREVLLLAEWEGLSSDEIASVLGCRPVTARSRLHRARRRFGETYRELLDRATEEDHEHV